jgi:hypothetical protein
VAIRAEDTSSISAITGAASLAAGFGGVGVAVSIGVSFAFNEVANDIAAYLHHADTGVRTTEGAITVQATEAAAINSVTFAASLGVAIGGVGVSVSGAGAAATNFIFNTTDAYVSNSVLDSAGGVTVDASDRSTINAVVAAQTASIAGGAVGVGVSIGGAFATNLIGSEFQRAGARAL